MYLEEMQEKDGKHVDVRVRNGYVRTVYVGARRETKRRNFFTRITNERKSAQSEIEFISNCTVENNSINRYGLPNEKSMEINSSDV